MATGALGPRSLRPLGDRRRGLSAAGKILDRLDRPRQSRPGQWMAACPCCQSKRGRPISLRETDDGRALIYAFCGCETGAVLGALGLELGDLFEKPVGHHCPPTHSRIPARDLLEVVGTEADVVAILSADLAAGRDIGDVGRARLAKAAARIGAARGHLHG